MNRLTGPITAVVGVVLVGYGYQQSQTVGSKLGSMVQASGADQPLWLMIAGGVLLLAGLVSIYRSRRG